MRAQPIPCPYVYANGKCCSGHVVAMEAYKADLSWRLQSDGSWAFDFNPRSHYHLYCSEKGDHTGYKRQDDPRMKFFCDQLPEELRQFVLGTDVPSGTAATSQPQPETSA